MSQDTDDIALREILEPVWFRVEARHWSTFNDDGDPGYTLSELTVIEIPVIKHTPKGAWLGDGDLGKKLVLRDYKHRGRAYAAPTLAQAKEDFRKRKQFYIDCLQSRINRAQQEIDMLATTHLRARPS